MHLIGLIIRIYHDARSPEIQIFRGIIAAKMVISASGDTAENVLVVRACRRNGSVLNRNKPISPE